MDINLHPVSGTNPHYTPPASKGPNDSVPASTPQQQPADTVQVQAASGSAAPASTGGYEAAVAQIAQSFKNDYAVSDQEFSIFKDATGAYITRYVSLRDGKVTYMPQPTYVKPLQLNGEPATHVAITA